MDRALRPVVESHSLAGLASRWLGGLRILGYHDVPDPIAFAAQIDLLVRDYVPVAAQDIIDALDRGTRLPARSVWLTFDDGYRDVIVNAQPVLDRHGIRAALFVCPSVVADGGPFWWHVAQEAERRATCVRRVHEEWSGNDLVTRLKVVPDETRRQVVAEFEQVLGRVPTPALASVDELRRWHSAGHDLGNHSWDHPIFDHCDADEQARQVARTHHWMADTIGLTPRLFAYPNGNWAAPAERELIGLGYRVGLGFDHRRSKLTQNPLRLSRLRVDSSWPLPRFRSIVSGLHPALYRARQWVRPVPAEAPRKLR